MPSQDTLQLFAQVYLAQFPFAPEKRGVLKFIVCWSLQVPKFLVFVQVILSPDPFIFQ
jgi:hypothetical protein